jgi:rhamnose transport system ATP-binding protein
VVTPSVADDRLAASGDVVLQATGISKSFGGARALAGVDFALRAGEVHGLVGENGAGKSTLIKIIAGAVRADAGQIEVAGRLVDHNDPLHARSLGIAVIYQQPALLPDLSVAENIAIGLERGGTWHVINWAARRRRAAKLLDRIGARIRPDADVRSLSLPEQQLVEIARSLGADARILIMDEPTASLSKREVEHLFAVVRQLRAAGVGIIYVSHRLEELQELADRVTVLRDGSVVGTRPMAEVTLAELIRLMVGRELSAVFPKIDVTPGGAGQRSAADPRQRGCPAASAEVRLNVEHLSCRAAEIHDISLTVRAGEILGLSGLVGAGRTELARVLFGVTPADGGRVVLDGRPVVIDSPARAVGLGIAYVPEDRRRHGVILEMSVAANATLAALRRVSSQGLLNFDAERSLARSLCDRLRVKTASLASPVGNLSGGNQQKVALARGLATEPMVLIVDEPTQGIDVGAKAEIHRLLSELAGRGLAIIMISSELPEIIGMSDRIAVMRAGQIAAVVERNEATQERLMALALGHADRRDSVV